MKVKRKCVNECVYLNRQNKTLKTHEVHACSLASKSTNKRKRRLIYGASVQSEVLLRRGWKGAHIANGSLHPNKVTSALSAHLFNFDFYSIKLYLKAKRRTDVRRRLSIGSKQKCALPGWAQNDLVIDFLSTDGTEQLPLKGQRGLRGTPWMAAWVPRWLFCFYPATDQLDYFQLCVGELSPRSKAGMLLLLRSFPIWFRASRASGVWVVQREWPRRPYHSLPERVGEHRVGRHALIWLAMRHGLIRALGFSLCW